MINFITSLSADGKSVEFHFDEVKTPGSIKFYVTAFDSSSQCTIFSMENKEGQWKIIEAPKPPQWIYLFEESLSEIIIQRLSQGN